uniref:hypothetical protein n=1 Tax=Cephaleuros karstenii TaxID=1985640 RepID=UPI001EE0C580|nr:hypothetical protein MFR52_pgp066 [Cephaleuros karstenii]UIB39093.1 hypothetical protein [Cephaleuros karstenii]
MLKVYFEISNLLVLKHSTSNFIQAEILNKKIHDILQFLPQNSLINLIIEEYSLINTKYVVLDKSIQYNQDDVVKLNLIQFLLHNLDNKQFVEEPYFLKRC